MTRDPQGRHFRFAPPPAARDLVDGAGRDDDGRFTLTAADGSAAGLTLSEPRRLALAQGLQADPGDGAPASDFTRDPGGPCLSPLRRPRPAPHGSTPGVDAAATAGEVGDVPLLLERPAANPPVAQAWALVHGLDLTALTGFGAGMTPVILLPDTLVTDHGYESGRVLLRRAVEQQGTAVLVDARGGGGGLKRPG